jgi:hypothetical protein
MSAGSTGAPRPTSASPNYWNTRGGRGRPKLKLMGSLRGAGTLVWADGEAAATYELDVFGAGAALSVSGSLEGDFAALVPAPPPPPEAGEEPAEAAPPAARLRLDGGRELSVTLVSLDPGGAEIEAQLGAGDADLLS